MNPNLGRGLGFFGIAGAMALLGLSGGVTGSTAAQRRQASMKGGKGFTHPWVGTKGPAKQPKRKGGKSHNSRRSR